MGTEAQYRRLIRRLRGVRLGFLEARGVVNADRLAEMISEAVSKIDEPSEMAS
jgi:hypothetical protein